MKRGCYEVVVMVDGHIQYNEVWITSAQCFSNLIDFVSMTIVRVMGQLHTVSNQSDVSVHLTAVQSFLHTPWLLPSTTVFICHSLLEVSALFESTALEQLLTKKYLTRAIIGSCTHRVCIEGLTRVTCMIGRPPRGWPSRITLWCRR